MTELWTKPGIELTFYGQQKGKRIYFGVAMGVGTQFGLMLGPKEYLENTMCLTRMGFKKEVVNDRKSKG